MQEPWRICTVEALVTLCTVMVRGSHQRWGRIHGSVSEEDDSLLSARVLGLVVLAGLGRSRRHPVEKDPSVGRNHGCGVRSIIRSNLGIESS